MLEIVPQLVPEVLTAEEAKAVAEFVWLVPDRWEASELKRIALEIAGVFDGFFSALSKVGAGVERASKGRSKCG